MKENFHKKETQKKIAAKNPQMQRRRRGKKKVNQKKQNMKTQRSMSVLKISPRSNVRGKWQKELDQS